MRRGRQGSSPLVESASDERTDELVARIAEAAVQQHLTIASAESLTGGQLACMLSAGRHSGIWYRGGVVAYHREVKYDVLGVPEGPVISAEAAGAMAEEARRLLGSLFSVAVTGVGGPGRQEGQPPGTVFIAVCGPDGTHRVRRFAFDGEPLVILKQTAYHSLRALLGAIRDGAPSRVLAAEPREGTRTRLAPPAPRG